MTTYGYNSLDMVNSINYNNGKEVTYQYNKVGDLVEMTDWTGTTTFEVDLLNRITKTTDTKGKTVEYTYDVTGNQTSISYPDGTTVTKTYDLLGQLNTVTEHDGRTTTYTYDGMGRLSRMEYPHGWVEDYHYDSIGQLVKVEDTDPSGKDMKQQKHVYEYDDCGNMVYEYMRGNGTGEATVENTYTYDALHRIISVHESYGNDNRSYTYDSLGNLTYETSQGNKSVDYKLNNLNQITSSSDDGWKTSTTYTYDLRGNLIQELYTKNKKQSVTGSYTYDETNKMVKGINDIGESSEYLYNGLGALVENTWIIKKNAYGYHDVTALVEDTMVDGEIVVDKQTGKKDKKEKKSQEEVAASPELNKTSTVVKQFVVDYTTETYEPLMEHEVNGLDYRYVYGNDRLSVNITGVENGSAKLVENANQIRLYYHMDYLGTADYLTSPMTGKVESWTHYNEWGEITHNAVLKCGVRELDLVKRYATHDYDQVLGMYYAKARFYAPENRRFTAVDPILEPSQYDIKDYVNNPVHLVQYLYVSNNPIVYIDPLGLMNYLTQSGNLWDGFSGSVGQQFLDMIDIPKAISTIIELGKALWNKEISIWDLVKAMGTSVVGPYVYVIENINVLNPFSTYSDEDVEAYGEQLGYVVVDIVSYLVGAKAAQLADYLAGTKIGEKLLELADDVSNTKVGQAVTGAIEAGKRFYSATIDSINAQTRRYLDTLTCTVWTKTFKERGFAIEYAIKEQFYNNSAWDHLVDNFPTIDVWNQNTKTAVSIKSIDLSAQSYQSASTLKRTLNGYVNSLSSFTNRTWSGIRVSNVQTRILEIAIPDIELTDVQIQAINEVIKTAANKSNPVKVIITVIDY